MSVYTYVIHTADSADEVTGVFAGIQDGNLLFTDPDNIVTTTENGVTTISFSEGVQAFPLSEVEEIMVFPEGLN